MKRNILHLATFLAVSVSLVACRQGDESPEAPEIRPVSKAAVTADTPDTTGASVWQHLQDSDYRNEWQLWPDKGELYTGQEPHGMLLTTYLNDIAAEALSSRSGQMPDGAILVKENYTPDSTLAAVTVMFKAAGYNPDHNDWFFSKHKPDGSLDTAPNGMPLEGRVTGCQNCHGGRQDNDYIFTGSLSE